MPSSWPSKSSWKVPRSPSRPITSRFYDGLMETQTFKAVIPFEGITLRCELCLPSSAQGVVLFADGSGSSRFSPRNQYVAGELQKAGLATLLMDLLEPEEAEDRAKVFDIELLAE